MTNIVQQLNRNKLVLNVNKLNVPKSYRHGFTQHKITWMFNHQQFKHLLSICSPDHPVIVPSAITVLGYWFSSSSYFVYLDIVSQPVIQNTSLRCNVTQSKCSVSLFCSNFFWSQADCESSFFTQQVNALHRLIISHGIGIIQLNCIVIILNCAATHKNLYWTCIITSSVSLESLGAPCQTFLRNLQSVTR